MPNSQNRDRRYLLAVEGTQVGVFERPDMQSDEVFWSNSLFDLLHYSREETPTPPFALVRWDYRKKVETLRRSILRNPGKAVQIQAPMLCGDGRYRWFSANCIANPGENGSMGLLGSIFSIEEVKEVEQLRAKERQLEAAVDSLTAANADLERFAHMASHDLQEPLRMVTAFMSLLKSDYADSLDDRARQYIAFACDGAERMQTMIDDLLLYAKVGIDAPELQNVNLQQISDDTCALLDETIQNTGAEIRTSSLPVVLADPTGLKSLMLNLIGNAIKYTRNGTKPEISIGCDMNAETWTLTVSDNGIGIPDSKRNDIFQPFFRLHGPSDYPGNGVGLAMCKRIAESWHGSISVQQKDDGGSIFSVTAPRYGIAPKGAA